MSTSNSTTTTLPDSEISSLTDGQERLIACLSFFSASLSVMGSSMIVLLVIKNSRKTPYKRILLGLSFCDIVASITWFIQPFLLPQDTSQRIWARGTDASCSFLGFLTQFAFSAIWYNGMLSFYYLCTVRFGVKTATFARRFEPFIHFLCIGYNLGTAIVGWAMGFYSEVELGHGCWIAEYPEGCEATGDCTGATIGWIFGGLPTIFTFFSILIGNAIIYVYVRKTTKRTAGKSMRGFSHQPRRIQAVATQALLYVGTFLVAYIWAFAIKVAESVGVQAADESRIFPVLVLQSIFLPMQGVFNLFVYSRPNYLRCRSEFPDESRAWALKRAWLGNKIRQRDPSVDASLWSQHLSTRPIVNIEVARQRAAAQFSATFSSKDPSRRDFRTRETSSVTLDLPHLRSTQILELELAEAEAEGGQYPTDTFEEPPKPSLQSETAIAPSPPPQVPLAPVLDDPDEPIFEDFLEEQKEPTDIPVVRL